MLLVVNKRGFYHARCKHSTVGMHPFEIRCVILPSLVAFQAETVGGPGHLGGGRLRVPERSWRLSDEESGEEDKGTYIVLQPRWRNARLTRVLHRCQQALESTGRLGRKPACLRRRLTERDRFSRREPPAKMLIIVLIFEFVKMGNDNKDNVTNVIVCRMNFRCKVKQVGISRCSLFQSNCYGDLLVYYKLMLICWGAW